MNKLFSEQPESLSEIGKRFTYFREQAGFSLEQAATRLDISPAELVTMEAGPIGIKPRLIIEMALAYHCQVSEFLNPPDTRTPEQLLQALSNGEISEGYAAHKLCGGDRLALRLMQEQAEREVQGCRCVSQSRRKCSDERLRYGICACPCHDKQEAGAQAASAKPTQP